MYAQKLTDSILSIPHEISLHFNSHFPHGSGLAGTRTSPFWS